MSGTVRRLGLGPHLVGWSVLYLVVSLLPLVVVLVRPIPVARGFWIEFGVALGFVGLAMMCLQSVLTARFSAVSMAVGQDNLLQFHRQAGLVAFSLVAVHPVILLLAESGNWAFLDPTDSLARAGGLWFVLFAFPALLITSLWRQELRIRYEWWRLGHGVLAVLVVLVGLVHVGRVEYYSSDRWVLGFWIVAGIGSIGSVAFVRLLRPAHVRRHPYRVSEVRPVARATWNVTLEPEEGRALEFRAGQFAFVTIADSAYSLEQHPFSIASGAESTDRLEFAVKELGDFTARIGQVPHGARAYVDGPYGAMFLDVPAGGGLFAVAGGIGLSPVLSMVRTLAARHADVPVTLVLANVAEVDVAYGDELDRLVSELGDRAVVVHVIDQPVSDGVRQGPVDRELLAELLPDGDRAAWQYVTCGPPAMMEAVETALIELGVPLDRIDSERFDIGAAAATGRRHTSVRRVVIGIGSLLVAASAAFAAFA